MKSGLAFILIAVSLGTIMDALDASIVNVVLPSIALDFGTTTNAVAWVSIVYTIMIAGLLLPFTKVADNGNIRKVFIVGALLFAIGALVCGLSTSLEMLIASRVLHGLGAAMMGSTSVMVCVKFLPPERLSFGLSIIVLSTAIGWSAGAAMGGFLADNLSWHWVFFVNVPLAIIALLIGIKSIPKEEKTGKLHMDYLGTALIFVAVSCGIIVLQMIVDSTTSSVALICLLVMAVSLALFVFVELRNKDPMLDVRIFKSWKVSIMVISFTLINVIYLGVSYCLPFYLQIGMGLPASFVGIMMIIPAIVALALSVPLGNLCDKYGRRIFSIIGSGVSLSYCLGFMVTNPEWGWIPIIPVVMLMGVSWGLCDSASSGRIIDNVEEKDRGTASGLVTFTVNVATAAGTALFASLLSIGSGHPGIPIEFLDPSSIVSGFDFSIIWGIGLAAVSMILAYIVKEKMPGTE